MTPRPAADKLRTDLSSTQAELEAAKAARAAAEAARVSDSESLRLKMGGMRQHMAKTAAELERERETAAAMKDRVNKLNANFIQTSDELRSTTTDLSSKLQQEQAARKAAAAEAEAARLQLGGTKQQMAKTAAELEKERETASEMKARVRALNETYLANGALRWHLRWHLRWQLACHCCLLCTTCACCLVSFHDMSSSLVRPRVLWCSPGQHSLPHSCFRATHSPLLAALLAALLTAPLLSRCR